MASEELSLRPCSASTALLHRKWHRRSWILDEWVVKYHQSSGIASQTHKLLMVVMRNCVGKILVQTIWIEQIITHTEATESSTYEPGSTIGALVGQLQWAMLGSSWTCLARLPGFASFPVKGNENLPQQFTMEWQEIFVCSNWHPRSCHHPWYAWALASGTPPHTHTRKETVASWFLESSDLFHQGHWD